MPHNSNLPSYGPATGGGGLEPFEAGEFKNLNEESVPGFKGVPEAEGEINAALGAFAGLRGGSRISSISAHGSAAVPKEGEVNMGNRDKPSGTSGD